MTVVDTLVEITVGGTSNNIGVESSVVVASDVIIVVIAAGVVVIGVNGVVTGIDDSVSEAVFCDKRLLLVSRDEEGKIVLTTVDDTSGVETIVNEVMTGSVLVVVSSSVLDNGCRLRVDDEE